MATTPAKLCPACGAPLPENGDFCPVCAFQQALGTQTYSFPDSSELRFQHYQVLKDQDGKPLELGHGGMGVTYKAIDTNLRCPVALKIINARLIGDELARSRFLREARAAASIRHSNVATVHHLGESSGNYFYAMEFVDGETLEALIRRRGRLETELALEIVTRVAAGLAAINKQRLVHRDIKPSNIMLSWEKDRLENVKIIDLGLAKGITEDALSIVGSFIGTPAYASPEQFAGLGTDTRSDLYSLGVTLWTMLSSKPPFHGSVTDLMDQHQHGALPTEKLKGIPEPVIAFLQVLLAKDPSERFQTPAQLQQAVAKVRNAIASRSGLTPDELKSAGEPVAAISLKAKPGKQTILWVAGSGLFVATVAIACFFFSGWAAFLFNQPANNSMVAEKSVAVLPFENIGANKDDVYFADGVQDEILNNLAKIAQLKVISRTSVMKYRASTDRDLRQIANALGVANVLEGTVRRDGNRVRVSTELIEARNDNTIWADSYDRDLTDIFTIQSEIAQRVAAKLRAKLSAEERKDIEEKPTDNLEAYDLYLQGKQLLQANYFVLRSSEKQIYSKIIGLLEQATQKDDKFALAYCSLAKAHDILYADGTDRTLERRALGDSAIDKALSLRPELPEVHLALATHLYYCYRDYERARIQLAIAGQTLSNNSELLELTAVIDRTQGRWEKSTEGLEKAITLDPRNPEPLGLLSDTYGALRRFQDAERILDRLIQLEPDKVGFSISRAFWAFSEKADVTDARARCEALPASIKDAPSVVMNRVWYALYARDFAAAEEILQRTQNKEILFCNALVPKEIWTLWVEFIQGNHPTVEQFGAAREQLNAKVEANPANPFLLTALARADLALGRDEEAMEEGRRAMELRPISEDAFEGPDVAIWMAEVYALANQPDAAFAQLNILVRIPSVHLNYGELKTNPGWDPLRKDSHFDKLLAQLAPRD
ncbi:MAG: protein kinase [Verrucomicrobia bacterium]|nr:protein kinase [Verrucomicrobiota bacterium]MBV8484777.1 protein kinase [Verrucomicrobiota bacterium]